MPKLYTTISECKHFYSKVFENVIVQTRGHRNGDLMKCRVILRLFYKYIKRRPFA